MNTPTITAAEFFPMRSPSGGPGESYAAVTVNTRKARGVVHVFAMSTPDTVRWVINELSLNGVEYRGGYSTRLADPVRVRTDSLHRVGTYDPATPAAAQALAAVLPDVFAAALALPEFRAAMLRTAAWYARLDAERASREAKEADERAAELRERAALASDTSTAYLAAAEAFADPINA